MWHWNKANVQELTWNICDTVPDHRQELNNQEYDYQYDVSDLHSKAAVEIEHSVQTGYQQASIRICCGYCGPYIHTINCSMQTAVLHIKWGQHLHILLQAAMSCSRNH